MCVYLIASYTKSAHLFALPQSESNAISLTELIANCDDNPDNYIKERKNLESDLISLNQIFNSIFYSNASIWVPAWARILVVRRYCSISNLALVQ